MKEHYQTASELLDAAGTASRKARATLDGIDAAPAREASDELTKILARLIRLQEAIRKAGLK